MFFSVLSLMLLPLATEDSTDTLRPDWTGNVHSSSNTIEVSVTTRPSSPPASHATTAVPSTTVEESKPVGIFPKKVHLDAQYTEQLREIARLDVNAQTFTVQPSRGWAYVNKPVYLQSGAKPISTQATLLDTPVTITAYPTTFTWHTGDGNSFTTRSPGGTYPDSTVTHTYTHSATVTLTLDITWTATYTIDNTTYTIPQALTTTTTGPTLHIREAEAVLTD